jgi:hypothetical protein
MGLSVLKENAQEEDKCGEGLGSTIFPLSLETKMLYLTLDPGADTNSKAILLNITLNYFRNSKL